MTPDPGTKPYDVLIVGCGLAGAALSWHLHWANKKILVVDSALDNSASPAAAGIISERAGKRHSKSWRWESLWPVAQQFYSRVESESGASLLNKIEQLRFIDGNLENLPNIDDLNISTCKQYDQEPFYAALVEKHHKGRVIKHNSAILDVAAYLDATITMLRRHHHYLSFPLDYADLTLTDDDVYLHTKNLHAHHIVFCEGWHGRANPWFKDLIFEPARGEALHLQCPDLPATFIYRGEITVSPMGDSNFYVGASYDRDDLFSGPTDIGKSTLLRQFKNLFNVTFEVRGHMAGVRPVIKDRLPIVKQHSVRKHCWIFNGLASRGCLQAPYFAACLASSLCEQNPLDGSDSARQVNSDADEFSTVSHQSRLTTVAHEIIRASVSAGDSAIDATAGNGNDTLLLARCTGPRGKVYAFDIQDSAIERATERLSEIKADNVSLLKRDHVEMFKAIPPQLHGKISAVMFNLGYLPGGDLSVTTESNASVKAIDIALQLLKTTGVCSILCYRGHRGGTEETQAVEHFLRALAEHAYSVEQHISQNNTVDGPVLYIVRKLREQYA